MSRAMGFVLLTHNKPHQALRLIRTLNRMFDAPPISWHHDFSQCDIPLGEVSRNVILVRPHIKTAWGKFCVIEAMLSALEGLFYSKDPPEWFILLSGADYPIKTAEKIAGDLLASPYDVHIEHEMIQLKDYRRDWHRGRDGYSVIDNIELCLRRYCALKIRIPSVSRKLKYKVRAMRLYSPLLVAPFLPFGEDFQCHVGEHWFCANRAAAEYLLEFHRTKPTLANHYRKFDDFTIFPEESYYQTVLCNAPSLKISKNHFRYIDWSQNIHPKTLVIEDFPKLHSSPAHFARKFDSDIDSEILDALDANTDNRVTA